MKIPELYSTETLPCKEKLVFEHWVFSGCNFHWLITELDADQKLAFGYAFLNDAQNAEWGYISIQNWKRLVLKKFQTFNREKQLN